VPLILLVDGGRHGPSAITLDCARKLRLHTTYRSAARSIFQIGSIHRPARAAARKDEHEITPAKIGRSMEEIWTDSMRWLERRSNAERSVNFFFAVTRGLTRGIITERFP